MTTIRKAAPLTPERRRLPDRRVPSFDSDNFTKSERVADVHQAVPISADELAQLRCEAALWRKVSALMTHERSGPHAGWTLGILLPGDTPADAVNDYEMPVEFHDDDPDPYRRELGPQHDLDIAGRPMKPGS